MADEQTQTAQTGDVTGQTTDKTFTQADVDRIVKERLQREQGKAEQLAQKAREEAEAKALAEQGKYKELFEKQQADLRTAADRVKALELQTLRNNVATKVGLPAAFVDRLRGETEAEIEADAKSILAIIPKPTAPNINANSGGQPAPITTDTVIAQKRQSGMYAPL
jgi:hypothetical protein